MASLNLNKVILCGRLTADPELKSTQAGVLKTRFTVAVNRRYTKEGEQPQADFITVTAWRNTAEFVCNYFRKGSSICVTGEITTGSYTTDSGEKRYTTEVTAAEAYFVDSKSDGQTAGQQPAPAPSPNWQEIKDDDQLPF